MASLTEVFPGFKNEPGMQIWRVEKMKLKPVPKESFGQFYSGDSYVVVNISPDFKTNVHSWIGDNSSADERGSVPFLVVQFDDYLEGNPTQYNEFQDAESLTFQSYFPKGIRYKSGGVASSLKKVNTSEPKLCVSHIKGRRHIRAVEVPPKWSSFNSGDCFLINLGDVLYHWSGSSANVFERLKTTDLAIEIRDFEEGGRPKLIFVEEGEEPERLIEVLGPKPDLQASSGCDKAVDLANRNIASLYQVSDAAGDMKTTLLSAKNPFTQDMLKQMECYILDNSANKTIYVWKGKEASKAERKAAAEAAQKFIKEKNYPKKTKVTVMASGAETGEFKHFFFNWVDKFETTGPTNTYVSGRIAVVDQIPFDASTLHDNDAMKAQHGMADDGTGEFKIWRVEKGAKVAVDKSSYGEFYGGDCYLVQYTSSDSSNKNPIIYYWQGQKSSQDEQGASAILAVELDDSLGGAATQVRVTQGKEPPHLVSLFKDKLMVIHLGGTSRKGGDTKPAATRLYHIRCSSTKSVRAVEVDAVASYLNSNDPFVLKTDDKKAIVWLGKGSTAEEIKAAKDFATEPGWTVTEMKEGEETAAFWAALGGKKEYQTSPALRSKSHTPRLFACSNATGNLIAEEVLGELAQIDLATDDVMILDCFDQLYIWIGEKANETEKAGTPKIAKDYLKYDPDPRGDIPIVTIKQGAEPLTFTGWFHAWDPQMWSKSPLEAMQQRAN